MELDKLAPALVALQADLTPVDKSASNPFFKSSYAPLPEVMKAVQPLLAKHKLAVSQFLTHLEGQSAMRTILLHESGQFIEDVQPLLLVKQDPQSQGSATTYARRYGVMSVLGVVADEDDDGNRATQAAHKPQPAPQPASAPQGGQAEFDELKRAKAVINEALEAQEYIRVDSKRRFIMSVIKQDTIENIDQANEVMDALDNERGEKS